MIDKPNINMLKKAWQEAAIDLCIDIVQDFELIDKGKKYYFPVMIKYFGQINGTLIITDTNSILDKIADTNNYNYSILFKSYEKYDRILFMDTLNDWGWFGQKNKEPSWYTGQTWS